jgi:hypothetical protein
VKRHACNVVGTCSKGGMEGSCAGALPARKPENNGAARERETNASEPLAAPEVAGRRETKEPCPLEIAKSMGARESNVPKERSAAVRRDGEPLSNAAKKRRQKEAAAAGKGSSSGTPEVGLAQRGKASLGGAEEVPPPEEGVKWVCPVNECRELATHTLDNCKGFEGLSITKRRKMLREWRRCECCLTDCRDRETGARCYRRIGFRRHHLLRLAVQQEVTSARDGKRQEEQPRGQAAGADRTSRDVPPEKSRRSGGGQERGKSQRARPQKRVATWCFPAFGRNKELVWLRATKSHHVGVTRITHQAAMRLGLPQSVTEAYRVRLRLSDKPQFVLRAEGVETLECVRPRNERDDSRTLQPDVIVSWADWDKVQPFVMSGWMIPGQVPPGATTPATKWHLRMNSRGSPPRYLNVQLDPMRKRTTITHEAAVRVGETFHSFYLLFLRTEAGEVGSLVAAGADAVVRADNRRPSGPAERGPDILLDAIGTRNMTKYLRAGWRREEEIGGRSGCPISRQWHGKLNAREVIRDPGWTCVEYVRTGRSERDIVMRVMFDTIREQTIILHSVAAKLGLRASGGPAWQAACMWYQSWTGRAAVSGSRPEA